MPLHYVCQIDIYLCVITQQDNTMNVSSQGAAARSNSRHLVEMKIWSAVRAVAQASPSAPFCLRALPSVFSTGIIQRFRLKSARSFPVSGMRLRLWPCECCRHKQARAGKQAQTAQTKPGKHRQTHMRAQSSTAKHKQAGTVIRSRQAALHVSLISVAWRSSRSCVCSCAPPGDVRRAPT